MAFCDCGILNPNNQSLTCLKKGPIQSAAVSMDRRVVVACSKGACSVLRTTAFGAFDAGSVETVTIPNGGGLAVLSRDGCKVAISNGENTTAAVTVLDMTTRAIGPALSHGGTVVAMQFTADSTVLGCVSSDRRFTLWDLRRGTRIGVPITLVGVPRDLALDPAGVKFAVASGPQITIVDAQSGERIGSPLLHEAICNRLSLFERLENVGRRLCRWKGLSVVDVRCHQTATHVKALCRDRID